MTGAAANINIWTIKDPSTAEKLKVDLYGSLRNRDLTATAALLRDAENCRTLVLDRGNGSENHKLLLDAFISLVEGVFAPEDLAGVDFARILDVIHVNGLPEQLVAELSDIFYHERNTGLFEYITDNAQKHKDLFLNRAIPVRIRHNLATWHEMVLGDPAKSAELNRQALGEARDLGDVILEKKIKFGLKISKLKTGSGEEGIKPAQRIADFSELADIFLANDCWNEAGRAYIEAAGGCLDLARLQAPDRQRDADRRNNLRRAEVYAAKGIELSKRLSASNLEVLSLEALARVRAEQGDKEEAEKLKAKAGQKRENIRYSSVLKSAQKDKTQLDQGVFKNY